MSPSLPTTMRAWRTHEYGVPMDVLQLDEVDVPEPAAGEVLVRALGIPFNLNDLERITGGNMMVRPELPYSPGMETMGIVAGAGRAPRRSSAGASSPSPSRPTGDSPSTRSVPRSPPSRCPSRSRCPTRPRCSSRSTSPGSDCSTGPSSRRGRRCSSTRRRAARGRPRSNSPVDAGAHVIATVGSDDKIQLCRDLGAETVVNYRSEGFADVCLEQTDGRGVDVVYDNVGEAVMEDSFKSLAYNGRYLMMGFASDKTVADEKSLVPRRIALGNFKLCGVMLSYADAERQAMMKGLLGWNLPSDRLGAEITRTVVDMVEAGRVRAVVGRVVEFEEIPEAITAMANRETVGRVVVKLWDD